MAECYDREFRRRMIAPERVTLMMPLNVVMVSRIKGAVDPGKLAVALDNLRRRHALLAVRIEFDEENTAWYISEGVPDIGIKTIPRVSADQWLHVVIKEIKPSFPIDTGPLMRFSLVHSADACDLIVCAHHAICDGISLTYLIRDILEQLAEPDRPVDVLPEPPMITPSIVPSPPPSGTIVRGIMRMINRSWSAKNIIFNSCDLQELNNAFWTRNADVGMLAWEYSKEEMEVLLARCRKENVTVNTALWVAFLASQYETQGREPSYRNSAGMAVNTRDKLNVTIGEVLGFYASSLTANLAYDPRHSFWDSARIFHKKIMSSLAKTNIFRSLSAELLEPSLLDSLYFSKYGLIESKLSDRLLKRMNWKQTNYGYAITNVGRMDIPTNYGRYRIESLYGPIIYSDVNEKTVGIITVGNKATFMMSYNTMIVDSELAEKIRDTAMDYLSKAVVS